MILDTQQLMFENRQYKDPRHKIHSMVKKGDLIPLKRGLYETDPACPGIVLACDIAGPSYLSFEYALAWHGMIPERDKVYTSAAFGKRKQLTFDNQFGRYTYRDIPKTVYPRCWTRELVHGRPFLMATREKALCDYLYKAPPFRGLKEFERFLFEGVRLDEDIFMELDADIIHQIAPLYYKLNLDQLVKLIDRRKKDE